LRNVTRFPSGVTGEETRNMTTRTLAIPRIDTDLMGIALAAFIGLGLIFAAGISHSAAVHDVAHDSRHAMAFPCH